MAHPSVRCWYGYASIFLCLASYFLAKVYSPIPKYRSPYGIPPNINLAYRALLLLIGHRKSLIGESPLHAESPSNNCEGHAIATPAWILFLKRLFIIPHKKKFLINLYKCYTTQLLKGSSVTTFHTPMHIPHQRLHESLRMFLRSLGLGVSVSKEFAQ